MFVGEALASQPAQRLGVRVEAKASPTVTIQ
jgi:hypothetical protein